MNSVILATETIHEDVPVNLTDFFFRQKYIHLDGDIDDETAADTAAMLLCLDKQDPKVPIQLVINSFDSDNRSVLMLYDVIKMLKTPVNTLCVGECMGGAMLLLAAGAKRSATKNASFQLSQLSHDYVMYSNILDAKTLQENFKKDNNAFTQAIGSHSSKKVQEILKKKEKYFFDSEEALNLKLIDEIIKPSKPEPEVAKTKTSKKPTSKKKAIPPKQKAAIPAPTKRGKK